MNVQLWHYGFGGVGVKLVHVACKLLYLQRANVKLSAVLEIWQKYS